MAFAIACLGAAACGGGGPSGGTSLDQTADGGGGSSSGGGTSTGGTTGDGGGGTGGRSDSGTTSDGGAPDSGLAGGGLPQKQGAVGALPTGMPKPAGMCPRAVAGLDVGSFVPGGSTPSAFVTAWLAEKSASAAPPFVMRLDNISAGSISASVGPVNQLAPATWALQPVPLSVHALFVQVDPANKLHISIPARTAQAVVSFVHDGTSHGFTVTNVSLDGALTPPCDSLTGTMEIYIPASNGSQTFGNSTVGDLLGPPTVDSNADGNQDAWVVDLAGTAEYVQLEASQ